MKKSSPTRFRLGEPDRSIATTGNPDPSHKDTDLTHSLGLRPEVPEKDFFREFYPKLQEHDLKA